MATTARGHIEQLPSGSFRVHVYAGTDPVTGKPRRLKQTCPGEASAATALGESPTAYLETGAQGITVRDPTLVSSAARMFDDLRDEALSRSRSLELIAEVEKP